MTTNERHLLAMAAAISLLIAWVCFRDWLLRWEMAIELGDMAVDLKVANRRLLALEGATAPQTIEGELA